MLDYKVFKDILRPLPKLSLSNKTLINEEAYVPFSIVKSLEELEVKKKEAIDADKLLIIYFYMDTCPVCRKLNATAFQDPKVRAELKKDYIAVKVNITDKSDTNSQAIKRKYRIFGTPSFVFFDSEGEEMKDDEFYGYQGPQEFLDTIE